MTIQFAKEFLVFLEKEFPVKSINPKITLYESEFIPASVVTSRRGTQVSGAFMRGCEIHVACGLPWLYDVLYIVAHEYRHLLQYDTGVNRVGDVGRVKCEMDAMRFGMKVAKTYCREHNIPIENEEEDI